MSQVKITSYGKGILKKEYFPSGRIEWSKNGKLHREDAPAVDTGTTKKWYLNGIELSEKEFESTILEKELTKDLPINEEIKKVKKTKL